MRMELVQHHEGEWIFEDAAITNEVESKFVEALDAYDDGLHEEAEVSVRQVLAECPNHIDALYHLGLFLEDRGDALGGYVYCQAAVSVGLQAIPETFRWADNRITWSHLDNRPFLRAYHALAFHRMGQSAWHDAIVILKRLLAVNPNDNQGARHLLPKCWFEVNDAAAVIDLCQRYADDSAPETLYSHALALAITKRTNEARDVLQHCVRRLPLVAKELLSRRHPEPAREHSGAITLGGADQAWEYWKEYGRYWRKSKSAMTLLREAQEGAAAAGQ